MRKNPSTALHENALSKPLTAYATNPDHYTVIPTTLLKAHHAFRHTNPSKTALSLENCQHTCHMNALFVLRPAKLRAFNFGHPCPSLVKGEVLSPEKNSGDYRRDCSAIFHSEPTLPKPHYPSKIANTLATLVKGEVLSPEKIRATTGGIASRCTEYCHSHNHLKSTVIPCSAPHSFIHCQRWGTVRQIALSVACNYI